jgi:peptide-methionine (S)-S-oxide reductase
MKTMTHGKTTARSSLVGHAWLLLGTLMLSACALGAEPATVIPAPAVDNPKAEGPMQSAVLAGGCFWGVQGVYQHVRGVREVLSGYAGGDKSSARYETVGRGRTGHAESVQIQFDPSEVSYGELLQIYFSVAHDPTQLNRQGPDTGTQYRSAIFYNDASQKKIAEAYVAQLAKAKVFDRPIVTTVTANTGFYTAEDYHQDFLVNNPRNPYIVINDLPKVRDLGKLFPAMYREQPVTVYAASASR